MLGAEAVALVVLVAVHLGARALGSLGTEPRSRWLSAAGGVSVAYVLVHLMPELASGQAALEESAFPVETLEKEVYLATLAGLLLFYGVEIAGRGGERKPARRDGSFWLRVSSFALYNAIIGYLVVNRAEEQTLASLAFFTVAMAVHFVVNDHSLREKHPHAYDELGRWVLVAAIAVGWVVAEAVDVPEALIGVLVGVIGGGVILNVFKEELPGKRRSSFGALLAGALAYAALLQLA